MKKNRLKKIGLVLSASVIFMLFYALFVRKTGIAIPCVFYEVTGLKCPGCGISKFSLAFLKGEFREAIGYNYLAPLIYLTLIWIVVNSCIEYYKTGKAMVDPKPKWLSWFLLILFIIWWIFRNIYV